MILAVDTPKLLISGGVQRGNAVWTREFHYYCKAILIELDPETGKTECVYEHVTAPELCPDDRPSIVFKSASIVGSKLYVSTETEVLILSLPEYKLVRHLTHPAFNDVHHAFPIGDRLYVASSGLDMIVEFEEGDEAVGFHPTLDEVPFARFDRDVDYRKVSSTKPHASHPNFVFELNGEPWATRCVQKDAVLLADLEQRIAVDIERVHDGHVHDGGVWFTTVNGHIHVADPDTRKQKLHFDLNEMTAANDPLGWCRGLLASEGEAFVGFSRIRPTKLHDNLRWIKTLGAAKAVRPTRVSRYDLRNRTWVQDYDLEGLGLAAVFSILPLPT